MDRIHRTSWLDKHTPKVVWYKEVVGLVYVMGVVETMLIRIVMASQILSSVVKRDIS